MTEEPVGEPALIQVVADDREAAGGVVDVLRQMPRVQVRVARLGVGDYQVNGDCLFERKSLLDFAASIQDGRLFEQARRLVCSRDRVALILEGRASDLVNSEMRREAMQGAIISLSLLFHNPILRSLDAGETKIFGS